MKNSVQRNIMGLKSDMKILVLWLAQMAKPCTKMIYFATQNAKKMMMLNNKNMQTVVLKINREGIIILLNRLQHLLVGILKVVSSN